MFSFGNQGPRVWRKRGEAHNPRCLRSSVKFPQSVMVWGAMSSAGVGPLCFLRSKVNIAVYQEVLEHFMLPAADQLYGDADFIFQQDLAPAHSAKASSTWFKDHGDQFVALMRWYGSPGFFDSGLQLICIFGLLFLIFLLTILHRFSLGFRSGEFAGQSSTPTPWSFNQFLVVWAGAKSCWKMKSTSSKSWSAEGTMKCSKFFW
uniref:Transposase n=1 Tax=Cyprinus carpio carpio TaxID=630221 RepID=A0A9J8BAP5_CYPCA